MSEKDIKTDEGFSQVSELFQKYEGAITHKIPLANSAKKPEAKSEVEEEVTAKDHSLSQKGVTVESVHEPIPFKLEKIDVTEIPINNTLTLKSYMSRSLTGILHQGSDIRNPFYYVMDIKNNMISGGPYTDAYCIFDSESISVYLCVQSGKKYYVIVDQYGVAHHEPVRTTHSVTDATFDFNSQSYSLPTKPSGKSAIERRGAFIVLKTDNKNFLINFEHGSLVGFSFEESKNYNGCIMVGSEEKYPLARLSPEVLLVRDSKESKEEYIVRSSRLVINKESVTIAGGWFFLNPNEERSTFSTFVPQELGFGSQNTFRTKNVKTYANGVYFGKEKILFVDTGRYFLNMVNANLGERVFIEDSLIFIKGGE